MNDIPGPTILPPVVLIKNRITFTITIIITNDNQSVMVRRFFRGVLSVETLSAAIESRRAGFDVVNAASG